MTKRVTFIHAADLHIDSPLRGLEAYEGAPLQQLRGATRKAASALVQLAIEESVDFVVIAGDLFDGKWQDMRHRIVDCCPVSRVRPSRDPGISFAG